MKKIFFILLAISLPLLSRAQELQADFKANLDSTGIGLGYNPVEDGDVFVNTVIGKIITILLGFVGIIFFVMIFIAGYQWLMSGGNADTIKKAKSRLTNSIIGLVVILVAYLVTIFIYTQVKTITK
jgi:4-hydroxybenzoate polyprenyltransferase